MDFLTRRFSFSRVGASQWSHAEMPQLQQFRCGDRSFMNTRLVPLCGKLGTLAQSAEETAEEKAIQLMQNRRRGEVMRGSVHGADNGGHWREVLFQHGRVVSLQWK